MCLTTVVNEVSVEVIPPPHVVVPDICPDGVFVICPKYQLNNQLFFMARVFGFSTFDSTWVPGLGGGAVSLRCQRRHRPSNANGDELGSWTAWTNVHTDFKSDHDSGQLPASFHLLLNNVNQGQYYLAQFRMRDVSTVEWEVHPLCGTKAYFVLMATPSDPGAYIDDRPVS